MSCKTLHDGCFVKQKTNQKIVKKNHTRVHP